MENLFLFFLTERDRIFQGSNSKRRIDLILLAILRKQTHLIYFHMEPDGQVRICTPKFVPARRHGPLRRRMKPSFVLFAMTFRQHYKLDFFLERAIFKFPSKRQYSK
jgi:hypothetical protein